MASHTILLQLACVFLLTAYCRICAAKSVSVHWSSSDEAAGECAFVFDIQKTAAGAPKLMSISMPPLETLLASGESTTRKSNNCSLVFVLQPTVVPSSSTNQPLLSAEDSVGGQPLFEEQLLVWPDEQDIADIAEESEAELPIAETWPQVPLYEDQVIVYPAIDLEPASAAANPNPTPAAEQPVEVLENYQTTHPNGTVEYKLVLSNGVVNYKRIYTRVVDDEVITVQEGYDSMPIAGREGEFQTQYYIADEDGFNVYKTEHSFRRPELPSFLDYKPQMAVKQHTSEPPKEEQKDKLKVKG